MNSALFIAMCVLALLNIIVYTFVSAAIHKRDLCQKSPYYHCDTSWQCCDADHPDCDTSPSGPQNKVNAYSIAEHYYGQNTTASLGGGTDHRGLGFLKCANGSSKPYYEACVQPIQVIMKNYDGSQGAPDFSCVYDSSKNCSSAGGTPDNLYNEYLSTSKYGVANFQKGQCCYQKVDADTTGTGQVPAPQAYGNPGNLYPRADNLTAWNSNGRYANNYSQPSNFIYPVGSNTSTQNNTCTNSLYPVFPGESNPSYYTPAGYSNCPGVS
jgi:hypothetical protein